MEGAGNGAVCPDGHVNPAGQAFCGTCGARIDSSGAPVGSAPVAASSGGGRSNRKWIAAAAVVAVVVAAGAAAFALGGSDEGGKSEVAAEALRTTTTAKPTTTTTTAPPEMTLTGSLDLIQNRARKVVEDGGKVIVDDPVCSGADGYDDLHVGTSVTVRNQEGVIVATGAVDKGDFFDLHEERIEGLPATPFKDYGYGMTLPADPGTPGRTYLSGSCRLSFTVEDIPVEDFYTVELGHRGEVSFSKQDLDDQDWKIVLTLS